MSNPVLVDNIWTEFAHSYDQMIPELPCYKRQLGKILRDTLDRPYVIDAGCGTGLASERLARRGHTVSGFDNNPAMLARAVLKQAAEPDSVRARWRVQPGTVTEFPADVAGDADAVVMNNVLFYVREPVRALREAFTHLKPGGVLLATSNKRPRPDLQKVLRHSIEEWKAEGRWGEALQAAVTHHESCARRLTTDPNEMVTFYEPDALVAELERVGFRRALVVDGDDYYGENFYVCMEK
ncbi:class I SAM-dependent methyltransferase [Myxococcaceae bacterium JPH2]|nr:class I SAM-dependent methyltransferase [Myxococcaceae bacterium JPH2]